jgi:hypothetical protein
LDKPVGGNCPYVEVDIVELTKIVPMMHFRHFTITKQAGNVKSFIFPVVEHRKQMQIFFKQINNVFMQQRLVNVNEFILFNIQIAI